MRILVTGLNGFTGQHVGLTLKNRGHQVFGLTSDLTDAQAVISEVSELKVEAVVHLAAIAFVGHGNINDIYNINLQGTRNLLEALPKNSEGIKHIVLASSANIYGNSSEGSLGELSPANPANDYAVSKYAMELMAKLWCDRLPITIVRPFNYTGVGQADNFLIPKIVKHFKANEPVIELGNLDVWREFNDVRFVADCYVKIIKQQNFTSGRVINICTGKTYSLREVVGICEKNTGHKVELCVNPLFVRENEVRVLKGDNKLLESVIGRSVQYDLEQTLKWMLDIEE